MPQISDIILKCEERENMMPNEGFEEIAELLQSLLDQPEGEPVAWHTEDHLTDRSATTYNKNMMREWQYKGWPVTPLYTHPPAPQALTPITADEVTDEMVTTYKHSINSNSHLEHEIAAAYNAVNAYLGVNK